MNVNTNTNKPATSFDMFDKAMDIVTDILGEELTEKFNIFVVNNVCKVVLPLSVPLQAIADRADVSVNFVDDKAVLLVH